MPSLFLAAATSPSVNVNVQGLKSPSTSIIIIIALTLLTVAPSLLILMTGFTRIFIVLGLTRSALGLQNTPPNQVIAGLSLILALFVMAPVISQIDHDAVQPYVHGKVSATVAIDKAEVPLKTWMLKQTRTPELDMFATEQHDKVAKPADLPMTAVVPAFVLSEVQTGFTIGFVIFIPFLVIDLVIALGLASLGLASTPPQAIALPMKLLLFVAVDGWRLLIDSLLRGYA
jgi:flagellar biosynthetic protein FliP